jgi:hypothetical protein
MFLQCALIGFAAHALAAPSAAKSASQYESIVDALIKKVSPSVVQILVVGYAPLEETGRGDAGVVIGPQRGSRSGFVIDPDGYIATKLRMWSTVPNTLRSFCRHRALMVPLPPPYHRGWTSYLHVLSEWCAKRTSRSLNLKAQSF